MDGRTNERARDERVEWVRNRMEPSRAETSRDETSRDEQDAAAVSPAERIEPNRSSSRRDERRAEKRRRNEFRIQKRRSTVTPRILVFDARNLAFHPRTSVDRSRSGKPAKRVSTAS